MASGDRANTTANATSYRSYRSSAVPPLIPHSQRLESRFVFSGRGTRMSTFRRPLFHCVHRTPEDTPPPRFGTVRHIPWVRLYTSRTHGRLIQPAVKH